MMGNKLGKGLGISITRICFQYSKVVYYIFIFSISITPVTAAFTIEREALIIISVITYCFIVHRC
jgi:hypothetical protein